MKYRSLIIIAALLVIGLYNTGCQKKDDTAPDPAKLQVQISSPATAAVYHKGDTVFVAAAVKYITQMHGYSVNITDTVSKETLYESDDHVHGDTFQISEYWVNTLQKAAVLRLRVTVILDHDGSQEFKDLYFNTQP